MLKWERIYLNALLDALHPFGDVLQVGFPEAAQEVQRFLPKTHIVIDQEPWQEALPRLGVFDAIFFDSREGKRSSDLRRCSEEEIDFLSRHLKKSAPKALAHFLKELEHRGQIPLALYRKMLKKYRLKASKDLTYRTEDESFEFFQHCLESHMRKGSRFTCFSRDATSKYEDRRFFEEIIANPAVEYREWTIPLSKSREALVIFVEKA